MCEKCAQCVKDIFTVSGNGYKITFDKDSLYQENSDIALDIESGSIVISNLPEELVQKLDDAGTPNKEHPIIQELIEALKNSGVEFVIV